MKTETVPAREVVPGRLSVVEDGGVVTIRLNVKGVKVEYKDGVLHLQLPKK